MQNKLPESLQVLEGMSHNERLDWLDLHAYGDVKEEKYIFVVSY